jgi:4-amino-4-deoxy-L-arabinose transferase-like glycosyltransferase
LGFDNAVTYSRRQNLHALVLFAALFAIIFLLHIPLLRLPYFWDEAGYYIPAARDLLFSGSVIPHSTVSNAHPPLVMAYLALCWKIFGYAPLVTRTAMLAMAAFTLAGVYRLAEGLANSVVALLATICALLYPVFFAQSTMAHIDLAAAGLTIWGLVSYFENRRANAAFWFCLAVMAKETAVLAPLALCAWECLCPLFASKLDFPCTRRLNRTTGWLLLPVLVLAAWYGYHYSQTGYIFGNPEFFRYNVKATLNPLRIFLALLMRVWQVFGHMNLLFLTLAAGYAMWRPALRDADQERPRIAVENQLALGTVVLAYLLAMAMVGGAVLARYMLPVVPLIIIVFVSTVWRRLRNWKVFIAIALAGFALALVTNPPYGFPPEDNLAYRDYVLLHQQASAFIEQRFPTARVLTAWPGSDELTRPYLGYVSRPAKVVRIEDFSAEQVMAAADFNSSFDVIFVFSTKYTPGTTLLDRSGIWRQWNEQFFGYHVDVPPNVAAQLLGGRLVFSDERNGEWVGVIEMERAYVAKAVTSPSNDRNTF